MFASFGLFYLGERRLPPEPRDDPDLHVPEAVRGGAPDDFRHPDAWPVLVDPAGAGLLGAVVGTQLLATLIAVYGVFMTPIGWKWALLVWGYALAWFLSTTADQTGHLSVFSIHIPVVG